MRRLEKFDSFITHPWHKKGHGRLKPHELEYARAFIILHEDLEPRAFEIAANQMFIDKPEARESMRNWTTVVELVASCANA